MSQYRDDNDAAQDGDLLSEDQDLLAAESPQQAAPLILVCGRQWYLRESDGYYQVTERLLRPSLQRVHQHVETDVETNDGERKPLGPVGLYQRYGRRADTVIYRMGTAGGFIPRGADGGTLVEGVCRYIEVEPRYDDRVASWLFELGGGHDGNPDRLLDWLSTVTLLHRPTAALYLRGAPSCGKSMLAFAVAGGWGRHIVDYADVVLGAYSGALARSPIVLVEERVPETHQERSSGALFKRFVGRTSHQYTEKYKPSGTIEGCARVIVTANDDNALRLSAEDQRQGEEAIGLRILHVVVPPTAAEYLASIGGPSGTADWVLREDGSPGRIWRHVMWLREHHVLSRPPGRLLVEGDPAGWLRGVAARSGLPQEILIAVTRWVCGVVQVEASWMRVPGGVWVPVQDLWTHWEELAATRGRPSAQQLGRALGRIGPREREGGDTRRWGYEVPRDLLVAVAAETHCVPLDDLHRVLSS